MNRENARKELESAVSVRDLKSGSLGGREHWLQLPPKLRGALVQACKDLTKAEVSGILGVSEDKVMTWYGQSQKVAEVRELVQKGRRSSTGRIANTHLYREAVEALLPFCGMRDLSRELGLSRSTLKTWEMAGAPAPARAKESKSRPKRERATTSAPIPPAKAMVQDQTAKELETYLARHRGKAARKYSTSERKMILELVDRFGSKAVHERFRIAYDTISRMKRRQETDGERKERIPMRYIPVMDIMRKHPGMGPMQVRDHIRRHLGLSMGVNSIRKIMEQNGWVPPFVRTKRVTGNLEVYEAARKNYMWHMDFKHQYVNRCKVFILFIQDDYSRYLVGHALADGEKIDIVLTAVEESIRLHGKPEVIMTDGGSAFFSWRGNSQFARFLEDFGIEHIVAQTPNVNGKLENVNQQVEKEILLTNNYASVQHFSKELSAWVGFYNFSRVHQGLSAGQVPADRYFPGAKHWYGENSETVKQQSLIAETMATLLGELKKPK